jgi:hypothetical protein
MLAGNQFQMGQFLTAADLPFPEFQTPFFSIVFPFQAGPSGIPAVDAALSFAMAALLRRVFHHHVPFLIAINAPEPFAMATGDLGIK